MKNQKKVLLFVLGFLLSGITVSQSTEYDQEAIEKAAMAKEKILTKDPGLSVFFEEAYGYAILPSVGKGGLFFGGAGGKGVLYKQGAPVGLTKMVQVTVGAQIGGKSYLEVIFFKTEAEYTVFTTGRFEVSAQVAAIAVTAGVSQTMAYSDGIAIITMAKGGFMAEASVGGQKFTFVPFEE